MKTISILNQKDEAGKTTIAISLSYGLTVKSCKVLLIDADY